MPAHHEKKNVLFLTIQIVYLLTFVYLIHGHSRTQAEPWLGSRFAQNCSGCHAPGRLNLPPKDRRCSLSCQGCHVNPSGGGMRSFYGKWNEQRWLRSFKIGDKSQKERPLPFDKQTYAPQKNAPPSRSSREPVPLAKQTGLDLDEQLFDRRDRREWIMARSRSQFEEGIPLEDPYREFELSQSDGTVAARYISFLSRRENQKEWRSFLMSFDLGMRFRPAHRHLNVVSEFRFLGDPRKTVPDTMVKKPLVRSLYLMADDLPYNIFIMTGYYLPLFGHYIPDHTHLIQRLISSAHVGNPFGAYRLLFKATSVGTAPNVPYLNIHRIHDSMVRDPNSNQVMGWALNGGFRFVTLGASLNYSIWQTEQKDTQKEATEKTSVPTKLVMHSLNSTTTFAFNRWYLGLDLVSIERDNNESFRRSGIFNIDSRLRVWREFYLNTSMSYARTDENLLPGYAKQIMFGVNSFLLSGVQWSLSLAKEEQKSEGRDLVRREILSSQWHLYL